MDGQPTADRVATDVADVGGWCDAIALLVADALVDGKVITRDDLERAAAIIAEELHVRLLVGDYPPVQESPEAAT